MRASRIVAVLFAGLLALGWIPGLADTAEPPRRIIEMRAGEFVPYAVVAQEKDVIVFRAMAGGVDVAAYEGADFDSFSAYPLGMNPYEEFTWQYTGGTVRFRSPSWSKLSADNVCSGMCGVITPTAPGDMPSVPVITSPAADAALAAHQVTISGTVSGATKAIRLEYELKPGEYREMKVLPFGGTGENRAWSYSTELPNGGHKIRATAVHPGGYFTEPSAPVAFTVSAADAKNPAVLMSSPSGPVVPSSQLQISGRAVDDVEIAGVTVTVTNDLDGTERTLDVLVKLDEHQPNSSTFYATGVFGPGSYTIKVVATDTSLKTGSATKSVIVLL